MHATKCFAVDEPFESFQTQGKFSQRERSFRAETTTLEAFHITRQRIFWPIDDPQVFAPAHFHCWLDHSLSTFSNEIQRFDDHSFAPAGGELFPPCNA